MRKVYSIIVLLTLLAVAAVSYRQPEYNWDMLPYMASVLMHDMPSDIGMVHRETYELARRDIPEGKFRQLTDSANIYRLRTYRESGVFIAELRYYRLKPLYIYTIAALRSLGAALPMATVLPSVISFIAVGILLLIWMRRLLPEPFAQVMVLSLMLAPFFLQSARASTPDMMTAALALGGVYLLIEKRWSLAGLVLLCASALVRIDAALFVLAILLYLLRMRTLPAGWLWGAIAVIVSAAALVLLRNPGMIGEMLVVRPAAERIMHPGIGSFAGAYLRGLKEGLGSLLFSSLSIVVGGALATLFMRARMVPAIGRDRWGMLTTAMLLHIAVRFILHPSAEDRFLLADYALIAVSALATVRELLYGRRTGPPARPATAITS